MVDKKVRLSAFAYLLVLAGALQSDRVQAKRRQIVPERFPLHCVGSLEESKVGQSKGQMSRIAATLWSAAGVAAWLSAVLPRPLGYWAPGVAAAGTVGLLAAAGMLLMARHITPLMHFFIVLAGIQVITIAAYFAGPQGSPFTAMLYVWAGTYAFYFFRRSLAIIVVVAIGLNYAALIAVQTGNNFPLTRWLLVMITVVVTSALVSYLVEQHTLQLARQREQQARLAVAEERVRIARELHDVVAHHVSVMGIQAAAARQVLPRRPEDAVAALTSVEAAGRQAMGELHQLVGLLRHDGTDSCDRMPQPGLRQLPVLVTGMRQAGLAVDLQIKGHQWMLPPALELSAFRIVQEALTNTLQHAGPVRTLVTIRYRDRDGVEIDILDDGQHQQQTSQSGGNGLVGMRERVNLHGGHLEAGPRPEGGFRVHAVLNGQVS